MPPRENCRTIDNSNVGGAEACSGFRVEVLGCKIMATQGDLTYNRQFESGRAQACLASEVERRGKGGLSER